MPNWMLGLAVAALSVSPVISAAADAQYRDRAAGRYMRVDHHAADPYYSRSDYHDRAAYGRADYDRIDERQRAPRRGFRDDRGDRGRCRDNGTGGTIIGAIAGGLLGNAAVGRHADSTAGTIAGAGVGALAGRAIDRNC